jgi:hypothetical protein
VLSLTYGGVLTPGKYPNGTLAGFFAQRFLSGYPCKGLAGLSLPKPWKL